MTITLNFNLTGAQIQDVLDTFLYSGIEALFDQTTFVEPHLIGVLNWTIRNNRRKISSTSKPQQVSCLVNILNCSDSNEKLVYYINTRLDRYVSFGIMKKFLTACSDYQHLHLTQQNEEEQREIERSVGGRQETLYAVISHVQDCLGFAYEFRNIIVNKYIGLCKKEATKLKEKAIIPIDHKDLTQNLIDAVIKALHKYDYRLGALTSYIAFWMRYLSQSTNYSHEKGLAYDIPHNFRSKIASTGHSNIGINIEDENGNNELEKQGAAPSIQKKIEEEQNEQLILRLMQIADRKGIVRLSLGADEILTPKHIKQMKKQMSRERKPQQ